ncbi:hypothetical protein N1E57_29275, partial [Pseudomonas aeruginosa]|nr:hypothetical protein [Pseudomonas aeruginosa]MCS9308377.1 hypothetical protein [Pseudomonas aeruginosa]MCS9326161.1 hypothetical protein [Pseudomonas aeruginosa]
STSSKQIRPWRPDLNETASTKPGVIHSQTDHIDAVGNTRQEVDGFLLPVACTFSFTQHYRLASR